MKSLIMYYSYTGNCKKEAELIASNITNSEIDVIEIKEKRNRTKLNTFFIGCPQAMMRKKSRIEDVNIDMTKYDSITLVAPIWSGYLAPAFNAMLELLPKKKNVELYICSAGGEAPKSKEGTCRLIKSRDCNLVGYHDIKTSGNIK